MAIVPAKNTADYTFKVGSYSADKLKVTKFVGTEGISQLYRFSVALASHDGELDFDTVLGQQALLTFHAPKDKRYVHGVVHSFEQMPRQGRWVQYHADIAPAAWTLSSRVNCRIFQDLTIPDIIKQVLADGGLASDQFRFSLTNAYAPREYCVQYRESDFAFISRLMEQYGLFYFFEHQPEKHVMVIGDDAVNHVPIA